MYITVALDLFSLIPREQRCVIFFASDWTWGYEENEKVDEVQIKMALYVCYSTWQLQQWQATFKRELQVKGQVDFQFTQIES